MVEAEARGAYEILNRAVDAANRHAVQHGNLYAVMSPPDLQAIDSSIDWTTGQPGVGQVGVIDLGEKTFRLKDKDETDTDFQVILTEDGEVSYLTMDEEPL